MTTPQEQETIRRKLLSQNPSINGVLFAKTGHPIPYETAGWGWGGLTRIDRPIKPKWIPDSNWHGRVGTGVSRRCPNTNRTCQVFMNYQMFLQCYNKFEHLGDKGAKQKCDFFLNGVPTRILQYYEELRADGDWKGIQCNYKAITLESEEGEEANEETNEENHEETETGNAEEHSEEHGDDHSAQEQDTGHDAGDSNHDSEDSHQDSGKSKHGTSSDKAHKK